MPTTVNGIGTHYYGKNNVSRRPGTCGHCGREVELQSYDTRLFFVVVFIPIVPLGRKRVLDDCPRCRRHSVMGLEEYHRFQADTLRERELAARAAPRDAQKAIESVAAQVHFGERAEAQRSLEKLIGDFADDADAQLFAASVYATWGEPERERRLLDRAFQLKPDEPAIRHARALALIEAGDLHGARWLLPTATSERWLDVELALAGAFSARSEPESALQIYEDIARTYPTVARQKTFRKAMRACEKAAGRRTSALPAVALPWGKLLVAAGVVAALAGGVWGIDHSLRGRHRVHVVNGYFENVVVAVDGGPRLAVAPGGRQEVRVGLGTHRFEVVEPWTETIEVPIATGFFERLSDKTVRVVNPGGLALVGWEEAIYTSQPSPENRGRFVLLPGHRYLTMSDIDHVFSELPDEIQLSSGASEGRRRATLMIDEAPASAWSTYWRQGAAIDWTVYLESWLDRDPDGQTVGAYAKAAIEADQAERAGAYLATRLDEEPLDVEWHRAYQRVVVSLDGGPERLVREYQGRLDAHPDDGQLAFLRARVEPDPAAAVRLFERSMRAAPSDLYAREALARRALAEGRPDEAMALAAPAMDGDEVLLACYLHGLLASRRLGELEREIETRLAAAEDVPWHLARLAVVSRLARGDLAATEQVVAELGDLARERGDASEILPKFLGAYLLYARADAAELENLARDEAFDAELGATLRLWAALVADRPVDVRTAMSGPGAPDDAETRIAVSIYYQRREPSQVEPWLSEALAMLDSGTSVSRAFRDLDEGRLPLERPHLDRLHGWPGEKAALLTLLAQRHPEAREPLLAYADALNYDPSFPSHLLRAVRDEDGAASP